MTPPTPPTRTRALNDAPIRPTRAFVLYWMTSFRRAQSNFSLDQAIAHAKRLARPLVVLEPLRVAYPHASDRLHAFLLQGMADNAARFGASPVTYLPYVETEASAGRGLLEALARHACLVVGDDWPGFFLPRMQAAAAAQLDVRFEVVDSNGLFPLWDTQRVFTTAHSFRTHLQKTLPPHLLRTPRPRPLHGLSLPRLPSLPRAVLARWPPASAEVLSASPRALAALPIDHTVPPVATRGGSTAAHARLRHFASTRLLAYDADRNQPETDGTSGLSPYLHFGHLSAHEVFAAATAPHGFTPDALGKSIGGARAGWWKLPAPVEAYLDQLITWRELAFNLSSHRPDDYQTFDSLPRWAQDTLNAHRGDTRAHTYSLQALEHAQTHDALWNAAQRQLTRDGWMHNVLRMLWGKKLLEWAPAPEAALAQMEHLLGKYALDGRDPVSVSGACWVLGRYDRAWGPERPVFGKVRYMSSANTARKVRVRDFLARYGGVEAGATAAARGNATPQRGSANQSS